MPTRTPHVLLAALVLAVAACGGGGDDDEPAPYTTALLDDDGHAFPMAKTDAATSAPHATARQAAVLEQSLGHDAIGVEVKGAGAEAVSQAVRIVYGVQAAHGLPSSAPVLLRGHDLQSVRAAVMQLTAAGFSRIWIVEAEA